MEICTQNKRNEVKSEDSNSVLVKTKNKMLKSNHSLLKVDRKCQSHILDVNFIYKYKKLAANKIHI